MDPTDPTADAVQPTEGQGEPGAGGSPYADYLARIPEEARAPAEEAFKAWDANYTRHQQEASQYRKQWEPYETLGVHQLSPDEVQWALQFRQAAVENPRAVKEWFDGYAQQHNLIEQPPQQQPQPAFDEFGNPDPSQQLESLLQQHLAPFQQQLEQITQWRTQQEEQAAIAEAQRQIDAQLGELKQAHPDDFRDASDTGPEKMMERFIAPYIESDPVNAVSRAFGDYQRFRSQIEKQVLQGKADAPSPPEGGGVPNSAPERVTSLSDASARAREVLASWNRATG